MTDGQGPDHPGTVLVVDDDDILLGALSQWLELSGFTVIAVASADAALQALAGHTVDAVLSDVRMPRRDGIDLLQAIGRGWPGLPVVLLTGHGEVPLAVAALKLGAFDFLTKPHDPDRLVTTLRNACAQQRLRRRVDMLEAGLGGEDPVAARLIGRSPAMVRLQDQVRALLDVPLDLLILGETGTGKEVVARTLHDCGPRRAQPFVAINCAALPADIIESELFGHEAGAFTGARQARIGKFEFAGGGTVFLDEIESMPAPAQAKLLRVLQERVVERVGANRPVPIDIRVISATKADLRQAGSDGSFRSDLYYRLAGFQLALPPLRQRGDDILMLFSRFVTAAARRAGRPAPEMTPATVTALLGHDWPGNVRELRSAAERFGLGLGLGLEPGAPSGDEPDPDHRPGPTLEQLLDAYERKIILAALAAAGGSVARALVTLGLPRRTLNEKMRRLGIERPRGADL